MQAGLRFGGSDAGLLGIGASGFETKLCYSLIR